MKTKDKILRQALLQFNTEGVERVTTSSLAKNLGISLGNLHYHFPNRDSIIRQLVDQFLNDEEMRSQKLLQVKTENFMTHAFTVQFLTFKNMWEYRFIFTDRLVIKRRMDYLEVRFRKMVDQRKSEFDQTMSALQASNIILPNISQKTFDAYFTQIVIGNNSWISYSDLFDYGSAPYLHFAECAIWSWKPYLTCSDEELEATIKIALENLDTYL
ncbi:TetR/AcrR family transcriptional regulator [uncultured Fluviicola sp.]|uniref:TetR/AcrR family transcriptional regulator n=1 Tax=uncultured Fluviicola sp. TaxID=463303 RepID=UPI0025E71FB4|nr:TetR/AcrR family transcriptional regulator [uncultured Fluviicola sp.]